MVSNIILVFLDLWNLKIFLPANHGGRHRVLPLFKISGSAHEVCILNFHFLESILKVTFYK